MFSVQTIHLSHFKNYSQATISFCPQVNCFVGNNGVGKTNVLDALYFISFTKSFFTGNDQQHIQQNTATYFYIEAEIERNNLTELVRIAVQKGAKKIVKVNNNEHKKLSDHIGLYPLVMIAPNDILLILDGSEERRKFMDGFIAQCDKQYLLHLLSYNKLIEQRNKLLKQFAEQQYIDKTLLQTYTEQLVDYGSLIYEKRKSFMAQFIPIFQTLYHTISNAHEQILISYESELNHQTLEELLHQNEGNDLAAQRTTKGIHKDELVFSINGNLLKKFGSQGQQKTFIIALKLAQYTYLKQLLNIKPLLLLDDIFEKLDEQRLNTLLGMIANGDFGQLFITDTHLKRLQDVFVKMPQVPVKYFRIDNGNINEI